MLRQLNFLGLRLLETHVDEAISGEALAVGVQHIKHGIADKAVLPSL